MRSLLIIPGMTHLPGGPCDPADPHWCGFQENGTGTQFTSIDRCQTLIPVLLSQEPLWEQMRGWK